MKKLFGRLVLEYLRILARLQLGKNPRAVIFGITGSSGKTSTRLALSMILESKGKVKSSERANSESGIPMNILGLEPKNYSILDWLRIVLLAPIKLLTNWESFDYYVVEMGIDSPFPPKNMDYLLKIVRPDVAIILNAGLVHSHTFDKLVKDRNPARRQKKVRLEIAKEKMKLAYSVKPTGSVILNTDQKELLDLSKKIKARTISIGSNRTAILKLSKPKISSKGFSFHFSHQGKSYQLTLPDIYEPYYITTFGSAIAAASAIGISPLTSIDRLQKYRSPAGRLRVFEGINDTHIIDSSYNASPNAVKSTLHLLKKLGARSHKIAVLGDMRELGTNSKLAHKEIAKEIRTCADEAILFGKEIQTYTLPLLKKADFPVHHFSQMTDLIEYLQSSLSKKSWILVKGSQNSIFLERAVEAILKHKKDAQYLCRRGKYWDKIRRSTP